MINLTLITANEIKFTDVYLKCSLLRPSLCNFVKVNELCNGLCSGRQVPNFDLCIHVK